MTKEIPLTQGKVALVDDDIYEWANRYKWHAHRINHTYYAHRTTGYGPSKKLVQLHREIMNTPAGVYVDHVNGDGLDCRRINMRHATASENARNTSKRSDNTSGFKGVSYVKNRSMWEARIKVNQRQYFLGHFQAPEDAARAYDEAARKYFGEFARTNEGETS